MSADYSARPRDVAAFAKGEKIDTDELDADTLEWLGRGMDKTADWLKENGGGLGPLIPNLGLERRHPRSHPAGPGHRPEHRVDHPDELLQGRRPALGPVHGRPEDRRGDGRRRAGHGWTRGDDVDIPTPDHAGGVASDGKYTYVTSSGNPSHVFTYLTSDLKNGGNRPVDPIGPPTELPDGAGAYGTVKDGVLYVGTHVGDIGGGGNAVRRGRRRRQALPLRLRRPRRVDPGHELRRRCRLRPHPPQAQGVVVRDGEYVFSTSLGRDKAGRLIVQERQDDEPGNGDRGDAYELPYMSEGIIELDGEILTTYESGADHYGPDGSDDEDLWANPYMTRTSLEALGLSEDIEVDPESLKGAAKDFDTAAGPLRRAANLVGGITVNAGDFGKVPAASTLATAVNTELGKGETSLDTGAKAVHRTSAMLAGNARTYTDTDDYAATRSAGPGCA